MQIHSQILKMNNKLFFFIFKKNLFDLNSLFKVKNIKIFLKNCFLFLKINSHKPLIYR